MAAIRNRDALARRLKDIERERELVRAEIEAVRRRMRSLAGAEPWSGEPRLREAVLPPGYSATTTDSGASDWDGAVRLDSEVAAMAQNGAHYQTLLKALNRHLSVLASAVSEGKR